MPNEVKSIFIVVLKQYNIHYLFTVLLFFLIDDAKLTVNKIVGAL